MSDTINKIDKKYHDLEHQFIFNRKAHKGHAKEINKAHNPIIFLFLLDIIADQKDGN